ncbi:MAG: bifunctional 5,10-methylenetetrahydrofolate dehydrogenase/5,10-methenyltetrahydrofolate cyclohydrolase [Candidatus Yanofskybacteria bacterium]|nr:bifunctional 5,10-methylenetetrahydrofolate dehydrogenase/5,10-methenyltetrahydrofolate cyclohydrolase [Candidatus Yanofskybacteria bacterium]
MRIIDGNLIAEEMLAKLRRAASLHIKTLQLAAILVSEDPGLEKFVRLKQKAAERAGLDFALYKFHPKTSTKELIDIIDYLNRDDGITGILVELPLPQGIETKDVLDAIQAKKDVDVLSSAMQDNYYSNASPILPPAVAALKIVVEREKIGIAGKEVVVFGQGMLVGRPVSHWLEQQGARVKRIDEFTPDADAIAQKADVIIAATGKPDLITGDIVKEDVIVVDFGYGEKGNKMRGDVEFETVAPKADIITPVPGGMGPIVVVAVLKNLIELSL